MNHCQQTILGASALCAFMAAAGCASAPQPLTELALARTAITQAEQAGAAQSAPVELSAARDRLAEAEHLSGNDVDMARWRARESESDARLAEATAQDAKARVAANELDKSLNAIRAEAAQNQTR
ncbi:MAG: DUF4398 domain-containing protein [Steroidobacteraceae bacterium]